MELECRKVKRPGSKNSPGQGSGWMGGGREVRGEERAKGRERERRNRLDPFLKNEELPSSRDRLRKGHPMLRGRCETEKIIALDKFVIIEIPVAGFANSSHKKH